MRLRLYIILQIFTF